MTNVLSALQGEIPGMVIQRSSGQPGNEDFKMNIRGVSSANGDSAPLVLVDGIPGDINMINPQDIDAISVLKDASASHLQWKLVDLQDDRYDESANQL